MVKLAELTERRAIASHPDVKSEGPRSFDSHRFERKNLAALTGLRFWAAMAIVAFHTIATFKLDQRHVSSSFGLPQGVTLFFVLSGFILTYNYSDLRGIKQITNFLSMRLARIWPTHVLCLIAACLVGMGVPDRSYLAAETWANVFLLHALIPLKKYFFALNFPSWSVSTEFVFYLFFPILIASARRHWLLPLLIASAMLIVSLGISQYCYTPSNSEGVWFGMVYINPITRMFEFALGISAALLFLRNTSVKAVKVGALRALLLECACVSATLFLIFLWPTCVGNFHIPAQYGALSFYLCESGGAFIFAALICVLALGRSFVSKLLSARLMTWLGEISFAIYMTHILVLIAFNKLELVNRGLPRIGLYLFYLIVVISASAIVHHLWEKPVRRLAKMFVVP